MIFVLVSCVDYIEFSAYPRGGQAKIQGGQPCPVINLIKVQHCSTILLILTVFKLTHNNCGPFTYGGASCILFFSLLSCTFLDAHVLLPFH